MSESPTDIESLAKKTETVLQFPGSAGPQSIDELLAEIKREMARSPETRAALGPLIGRLRAAHNTITKQSLNWIPVLQGHLAIGHRPKVKTIRTMRDLGGTHVLTLLSGSEGAEDIGREVRNSGLEWIWCPLKSAAPPSEEQQSTILDTFNLVKVALSRQARIYIHCAAGIHRTGMITYGFLRHTGMSADESQDALSELRQQTAEGVGSERQQWGDQFA